MCFSTKSRPFGTLCELKKQTYPHSACRFPRTLPCSYTCRSLECWCSLRWGDKVSSSCIRRYLEERCPNKWSHLQFLSEARGCVSFVPRMIVCRVVTYLHKLPRCTPLGMRTCSPWVRRSVHRSALLYRDYWRKDPATTNTHNGRQSGPGSQR